MDITLHPSLFSLLVFFRIVSVDVCVSSCVHSVYLLLALIFFHLPVKPNHDVPDENIYWIIGRWFYLPFRLEMLYMLVIGLMILWPFHWQNEPTSELTKKKTHHTQEVHNNVNEHTDFWLTCCVSKNQNETEPHNSYSAEKAIGVRKRNLAHKSVHTNT